MEGNNNAELYDLLAKKKKSLCSLVNSVKVKKR